MTNKSAGMMQMSIRVNFHCEMKAITKEATNVAAAAITCPSFSPTAFWTSLPLDVACIAIDPAVPWSKKPISWLRAAFRKV